MNIQFRHRCLSMMLVLVMLFTMMPATVIAEEEHDHAAAGTVVAISDEAVELLAVETLKVSASASANHVYVGDGTVSVNVKISGGVAPYEVTLQAVKNGDVASTDAVSTEAASAKLSFTPAKHGDYELVVSVRDAANTQELVSISLAVAEHDEETEADWAASVSGAAVSANWARSLVNVAKSQVGYAESYKDFTLRKGVKQFYSRYGAWYGTPYGDWNNAFVAFVAEYANVPSDALLSGSSYRSWVNGMSAKGAYHKAGDGYAPKAGDIAFLSGSRVAIVENASADKATVIEGDVDGAVVRKTYAISKAAGFGDTALLNGLYTGAATPVPTAAPEATKAPDGTQPEGTATPVPTAVPTATPVPEEDEELTFKATPTPGPGVTVAPKDDTGILGNVAGLVGDAVQQLDASATAIPAQFSEAYYQMQDEMRKLAAKYLGEGEKTPAEIKAYVDGLELGDLYYIVIEIGEFEDYAKNIGISEHEMNAVFETEETAVDFIDALFDRYTELTTTRASESFTLLNDQIEITWTSDSGDSTSKGAVGGDDKSATFTAWGRSVFQGGGKTLTIVIKNNTEVDAVIGFTYSSTNGTFSKGNNGGSESITLGAGATTTYTLRGPSDWGSTPDATLTMSNFTYAAVQEKSTITFEYDSTMGSVTANGASVPDDSFIEVEGSETVTLVAAPASGVNFVAWTDADGNRLSTEASYEFSATTDKTIRALFSKADGTSPATFLVDNAKVFDNLKDANTAAMSMIMLLTTGTLPAGEYTIDAGKTLLIPFDDAHTLYTDTPAYDAVDGFLSDTKGVYTTPTAFRTLKMQSGAHLTVNGAMSLSAKHHAGAGSETTSGAPTGPVSFVRMESGSSIDVYGSLYAWGFITGSGNVNAYSGAKVYENFQFTDFRGGTATTDMQSGVFPLNQYYVQNIEVPLTLHKGATEYSYTSIYMSSNAFGASVPFISSSNAMFTLTSGFVTKRYDGATDRLIIEMYNGEMAISPISMKISSISLNSANYDLPINGNISVHIKSGSNVTLGQDIVMLPGSEIIVENGATCTMGSGASIFVFDSAQWGGYCGPSNATYIPVVYAPGRTGSRGVGGDVRINIAGAIDGDAGYVYTTAGGASITGVEGAVISSKIGEDKTQMYVQNATQPYVDIACTPAQLLNGVNTYGEYTEIKAPAGMFAVTEDDLGLIATPATFAVGDTVTYKYIDGVWTLYCTETTHYHRQTASIARSCETEGKDTYASCTCGGRAACEIKTGTVLGHDWADATCTAPKTCQREGCGATEGEALGHDLTSVAAKAPTCTEVGWYAYEICSRGDRTTYVEIPAKGHTPSTVGVEETLHTCTTDGQMVYRCTECNEVVKTEVVPADHDYDSGEVTNPKCEERGYTTYTCKACGDKKIDNYVDALGHTEDIVLPAVAATCTTDGKTEGKRCSVCQKTTVAQTVVNRLGHALDDGTQTVAPGCETAGEKVFKCTREDCTYTKTEPVSATGHVWNEGVETTPATCEGKGVMTYTCQNDATHTKTEEIVATRHAWDEGKITTDPTCIEPGVKTFICGNDASHTKTESVAAAGHQYAEVVTAPTCTEQGYTTHTCSKCQDSYVDTYVDALTHDIQQVEAKAPTCTEIGWNAYEYCNRGDFTTYSELAALNHDWVAATCTTPKTCKREGCGVTEGEELGHDWVDATCTTPKTCKREGCGQTEGEELGHSWVDATCTTPKTCSVCQTTEGEKLGHSWVDATCTTPKTCSVCKVTEGIALDHHGTGKRTEPTCLEDGFITYTCDACGTVYFTQHADDGDYKSLKALDHDWSEATCTAPKTCQRENCGATEGEKLPHDVDTFEAKAAGCESIGWDAYEECKNCDYTTYKEIAALGHDKVTHEAQEPACGKVGWNAYETCTRCDYSTYEENEIPALEHVYEAVVTAPTCTEKGFTTHTCKLCGDNYTDSEVPALEHEYTSEVTIEPTCTEDGVRTFTCIRGDDSYTEPVEKLDHDYEAVVTAPTCTEQGYTTYTCKREDCGHSYKDNFVPAAHKWTETSEVVTPATCTQPGVRASEKCSVCGEQQDMVAIPVLGHDYILEDGSYDAAKGQVVTAATCTVKEVIRYTCTRCTDEDGHTKDVEGNALGHDLKTVEAQAATCTEIGWNAYEACQREGCDYSTFEQNKLAALDHDIKQVEAQAPTCTEIGWDAYESCTRCDYTTYNELAALNHDLKQHEAKAPTCTEIGWDAYETCKRDGCEYTTYNELKALDHDLKQHEAKTPTCAEIGWEAYETCNREGCEYTTYKQLDKAAHVYTSKVTTEATCVTPGVKTYTCGNCAEGVEGHSYTEEISATGVHTPERMEEIAATCTTEGRTGGTQCAVCDKIMIEPTVVEALDHDWADATCTEPKTCKREGCGVTEGEALGHTWVEATCVLPKTCSVCKETEGEALGHKYDAVVTAPTCTAKGYTTYTCSVCDDSYVGDETDALGHSYESVVTAPTCTVKGYTTHTCSVCGHSYKDSEVAATGHTEQVIAQIDPTCTKNGVTEWKKCSVCNVTIKPADVIGAPGHDIVIDEAVAETCETTGLTEGQHCSRCDEATIKQEVIAAKGHKYAGTVDKEATCTEDGLKTYVCEHDETHTYQEVLTKLGHAYVDHAAQAATCEEIGWDAYQTCERCDYTSYEEIAALGHKEVVDARVEPTCEENGLTEGAHCEVCGKVTKPQNTINKLGHKEVVDVRVEPTCETSGLTEGKHCSVCEKVLVEQEVIPALNHDYAGTQTKAATCTEDGVMTYVCKNDAMHTYTEVIEALGHAYVDHEAQKVTCDEIGWDAYQTCERCDYTTYEEIAALGHKLDEGTVTKPFTCTEAGEKVYKCQNEGCEHTVTEALPAQHTPVVLEAVAPTCTEPGLTEGSKCSACGEVLLEQKEVAAAHAWEDVKIHEEATCTTAGSKDVRCTVEGCGAVDTIVIPAKGHEEVIDPKVDATCESDGLTEGKHCSVCGEVLVAQEVKPGGHSWSKAPCTSTGAFCRRCDLVNTELLEHVMLPATCTEPAKCKYGCGTTEGEKLGHKEVAIEEIPPLCEEDGWTSGKECSVCHAVTEAPKRIPAIGHNIVEHPAKKPTFTSVGWEAYEACEFCAYSTRVDIPALGEQTITNYADFVKFLPTLEQWAAEYSKATPGTDPVALVIKYIRTGVERYNSGSWGIMAGYEDAGFAKYVSQKEDEINQQYDNIEDMLKVSALKNLKNFKLPNGDLTDIGHMFGTMDITYHNGCAVNHADVGGWAGDLVDLLSTADHTDHKDQIASAGGDFEKLVAVIRNELLGHEFEHSDVFSQTDLFGDMDGYYVMRELDADGYTAGDMTKLFERYFTVSLTDEDRAAYMLEHRFNGVATRSAVREAVYTAYTSNNVVSTLEGTRDFNNSDLIILRMAVCYAFADYLCELAGDYVDVTDNPYLEVFESSYSNLAPGISMEIHKATSADNKQMVYYLAYAAVGRDDVTVYANYENRYVANGWKMSRVIDQANNTQELYSNPESEHYIENFNVITGINASGFNMSTGEPSGLMIMHGDVYHNIDGNGFFGILKDGTPVIATMEEYNTKYKGNVQEAVAGFGTMLVKNGEMAITATTDYYTNRASRTAVGITATGRVVFMVLDGRQEPWSCGGSMIEIAQIMKNAGCINAVNLDGGGSTTFVARQAGDEELSVVNRPSDGVSRSVANGLLMISTAPSSTAFDHALIEAPYANLTVGTSLQMTATGVSATGNVVDLPEGTAWKVADETMGTIDENGVFTALKLGSVDVQLLLGDAVIGQKTMNAVVPDQLYFTRDKIDGVYGSKVELPLKARYDGKDVAFNAADVAFALSNATVGSMEGLAFKAVESSDITNVTITAALAENAQVNAKIAVVLFKQGENSFDFDQATGGSRILAWQRTVSNSKTADNSVYYIVNPNEDMVTSYVLALDMTQIPIPKRLEDLTYMLPGSDIEGASAWTFLMQLAERISVLTEVKPQIKFDPNFDVDYSEIKLINEYFELNESATVFDEETNTLTLTLNWIDQTHAIAPETANPLCMVTGLKVTPKADAVWNEKDQLKPVNSGKISYAVYMRASGLYSFAQKPENQEVFGLKPFVNPNDPGEKGGYFQDTYTQFTDSYTLVRALKNGWYNEDSGFRYYVDGVYQTGIAKVEGLYYDFGENGVNQGQKTYTGLHVMNGNTYYIKLGEIVKGWHNLDGVWYYFDNNGVGVTGKRGSGVEGVTFEFENGRLLQGCWLKDEKGLQYYYGPEHYYGGWKIIDGKEYFFVKYYVQTGILPIQESHDLVEYWYEFTDEGVKIGLASDGMYWHEGELFYVVDGLANQTGLVYYEGNYYYLTWKSSVNRNTTLWVTELNGLDFKSGKYRIDGNGHVLLDTAVVLESDGKYHYYKNGAHAYGGGLVCVDDAYYYIQGDGTAATNAEIKVTNTNGLMPKGTYTFGADGRMIIRKPGDADLNGRVDLADAVLVYQYGSGKNVIINLINADVNADGKVDAADGLLIMQYDAGWDVTLK